MAKKKTATIKLEVSAGTATPAGTVGPACGQKGVPAKAFCDQFNSLTKELKGKKVGVKIEVNNDKTFSISFHQEENTVSLIKKELNSTGKIEGTTISYEQLLSIAKKKAIDTTANSIESSLRSIIGTAKSMHLIIGEKK